MEKINVRIVKPRLPLPARSLEYALFEIGRRYPNDPYGVARFDGQFLWYARIETVYERVQ